MIKPKYIFLHHSLTKDSGSVSWGAIRKYHVNDLDWRDIGYNYGIELIYDHLEILVGRMEGVTGAHTKGYNNKSIGICLVGNFDKKAPEPDQWLLLLRLVKNIAQRHNIPVENVMAHREVSGYKSCPGSCFDINKFRNDLKKIMPAPSKRILYKYK